ncbi:MAG TPA: hypothetical protein VIG99_26145 [Myxococcaceae bacterium]
MAESVDPALRALWSLGGAPGAALRALERTAGELERFEPEVEEAEEIAQAAVAPLLSSPQASGARALERALARREEVAPVPGEPAEEVTPARPRPRSPARRTAADAPRAAPVPSAAERPARALDANALERMAAPAGEAKAAARGAPVAEAEPRAIQGTRALPLPSGSMARPSAAAATGASTPPAQGPVARSRTVSAAEAQETLSRRAEQAGAAGALHQPVSGEAAAPAPGVVRIDPGIAAARGPGSGTRDTNASNADGRSAHDSRSRAGPDDTGAQAGTGGPGAHDSRSRAGSDNHGPLTGAGGSGAHGPPALAESDTLSARSGEGGTGARTGSDSSATGKPGRGRRWPARGASRTEREASGRPVVSRTAAQESLARRAKQAGAGGALGVRVSAAVEPDRSALLARAQMTHPPAPETAPGEAALERALARVGAAPAPRRAIPEPGPAARTDPATPGGRTAPRAPHAPPASTNSKAPEPALEGLAGLVARASSAPAMMTPEPPIPAVLVERMEEAQLARRLERILRREAEQAGVDLEGFEP